MARLLASSIFPPEKTLPAKAQSEREVLGRQQPGRNGSGLYHSDRGYPGDAETEYKDDWLDLGIDSDEKLQEAVQNAVNKAVQKGISESGAIKLHGFSLSSETHFGSTYGQIHRQRWSL